MNAVTDLNNKEDLNSKEEETQQYALHSKTPFQQLPYIRKKEQLSRMNGASSSEGQCEPRYSAGPGNGDWITSSTTRKWHNVKQMYINK